MQIEYNPTEYKTLETQNMDPELSFKLVKFDTGYYGIISQHPTTQEERVVLLSPENETGCELFDIMAKPSDPWFELDNGEYFGSRILLDSEVEL